MSKFLFAIFLVTVQYVRGYQIGITKRQAVLKPTVTITDYTPFKYLRNCEQSILSKNNWMGGEALGCSFPFDNSCYCNTAKRAVASSYISSCVFTYCSDYDFDYTAAVSVYDQYCGDVAAGITPRFHDTPLTETVTITDMREWSGLGTCGQQILSKNNWLKEGLKCPNPWFNNCYCDRNLAPLATSYISSCIFTYCSTLSADFDEALNVYNSYCASTGVKGAAQPTSTGTGRFTTSRFSASPGTLATSNGPSSTATDSTGSSDSTSSSNSSLSKGSIIGIVVSVVVAVIGIIVRIYIYKKSKNKK